MGSRPNRTRNLLDPTVGDWYPDNHRLYFGNDRDFSMYWDATNSEQVLTGAIRLATSQKYNDNVLHTYGTDDDFTLGFDGTQLEILPATDDTGAFNVGDGTTDCDVKIFLGSTSKYALFDMGNERLEMAIVKSGSSQTAAVYVSGTAADTYGSRHYNGNSQFSGAFMVGTCAAHLDDDSTGGAWAAYCAFIDVDGIKTNNNDVTACFSGRLNITKDQTVGDMACSTMYARNSAQALSGAGGNNLFAVHLDYMYMGTGSSTQSLRGHWIDVLEQATTPDASRDWIIFGTQVTGGALSVSGGNITAFYCNMISSDLETRLTTKAAWFRGSMKIGIDLGGITLVREATPTTSYGAAQIVLAEVSSRPVSIFTYAGDPSGASTVGQHAKGAICIDTTNGRLYMNVGSAASPTWSYVTNWT